MDFMEGAASRNEKDKQKFKERLLSRLNGGEQTISAYRQKITDQNVVMLLGNTKSGKSTLINYLIGTDLEAFDTGLTGLKIRANGNSEGPEIGNTALSETTVPGVYTMEGTDDMVISDSPGFDDNRGPEQSIINSIFMNQLKHAKTVRFAIVADLSELINDNVNLLLNTLKHMDELLSKCLKISPDVAVIITKVPERCTQGDISDLLKRQVLKDEFKFKKHLVETAVYNQDLIGLFKTPTRVGRLGNNIHVNIKNAFVESQMIDVQAHQIALTLSQEASATLKDIYQEYIDTNYFTAELNNLIKGFEDFFKEQWVFASYDEELEEAKLSVELVKSSLEKEQNMSRNRLSDIQTSLESLLGSSTSENFVNNFKFIVTLDEFYIVEEQYKDSIKKNYKLLLDLLLQRTASLLQNIEIEIKERQGRNIKFPLTKSYVTMSKCVVQNLVFEAKHVTQETVYKCQEIFGKMCSDELPQEKRTEYSFAAETAEIISYSASFAAETLAQEAVNQGEAIIFAAAAVNSFGTGVAIYFMFKEIYGKRINARKAQGRKVYKLVWNRVEEKSSKDT